MGLGLYMDCDGVSNGFIRIPNRGLILRGPYDLLRKELVAASLHLA